MRQEYETQQALLAVQPPLVQRFLEARARQLADAFVQRLPQARFTLPDRVVVKPGSQASAVSVLAEFREQLTGGLIDRLTRTDIRLALRQRLAAAQDLNRGLSISLPYFDDQELEVRTHNFEVIPAGRIMFVPGFMVRASREEQAKVAQDTRLSPSSRKHLLAGLKFLAQSFKQPRTF